MLKTVVVYDGYARVQTGEIVPAIGRCRRNRPAARRKAATPEMRARSLPSRALRCPAPLFNDLPPGCRECELY
jgi:hypothetical protein